MHKKSISIGDQAMIHSQPDIVKQELFTEQEASAYLRISKVSLWRERKAGRIAFHRISGRIVYSSQQLNEFLERNKREAFAA